MDAQDAAAADALAQAERVNAALNFARRRRLGPYSSEPLEREGRQRALAAMMRAGHAFGVSQAILALAPGSEFDIESLFETR